MIRASSNQAAGKGVLRHRASENEQPSQGDPDQGLEAFDVLGGWRGTADPVGRPWTDRARKLGAAVRWLIRRR